MPHIYAPAWFWLAAFVCYACGSLRLMYFLLTDEDM